MSSYLQRVVDDIKYAELLYEQHASILNKVFMISAAYIVVIVSLLVVIVRQSSEITVLKSILTSHLDPSNNGNGIGKKNSRPAVQSAHKAPAPAQSSSVMKTKQSKHALLGNLPTSKFDDGDDGGPLDGEGEGEEGTGLSNEKLLELLRLVKEMQGSGDLKEEGDGAVAVAGNGGDSPLKSSPPHCLPAGTYLRQIDRTNRFEFFSFLPNGQLLFGSNFIETGTWSVDDEGRFVMKLNVGWEPVPLRGHVHDDQRLISCNDGTRLSFVPAGDILVTDDCYIYKSDSTSPSHLPSSMLFSEEGTVTVQYTEGGEGEGEWAVEVNAGGSSSSGSAVPRVKVSCLDPEASFEIFSYMLVYKKQSETAIYICKEIVDLNS